MDHFRWVEKDRDGALEDAAHWRHEFERLDESLRRLTRYLRKHPRDEDDSVMEKEAEVENMLQEEKKDDASERNCPADSVKTESLEARPNGDTSRDTSLLDDAMQREEALDALDVPGAHFSALYNACEQLR